MAVTLTWQSPECQRLGPTRQRDSGQNSGRSQRVWRTRRGRFRPPVCPGRCLEPIGAGPRAERFSSARACMFTKPPPPDRTRRPQVTGIPPPPGTHAAVPHVWNLAMVRRRSIARLSCIVHTKKNHYEERELQKTREGGGGKAGEGERECREQQFVVGAVVVVAAAAAGGGGCRSGRPSGVAEGFPLPGRRIRPGRPAQPAPGWGGLQPDVLENIVPVRCTSAPWYKAQIPAAARGQRRSLPQGHRLAVPSHHEQSDPSESPSPAGPARSAGSTSATTARLLLFRDHVTCSLRPRRRSRSSRPARAREGRVPPSLQAPAPATRLRGNRDERAEPPDPVGRVPPHP